MTAGRAAAAVTSGGAPGSTPPTRGRSPSPLLGGRRTA